ncbi:MAG: AraC family transcriptional regulator [Verrucomicrobiota bacterium]|nr:AraC family transcriptional regulator [Verrucomicrobiota bacterium]
MRLSPGTPAPLELSKQISKGRYSVVPANAQEKLPLLCAGREITQPCYLIERDDYPFWVLELITEGAGTFHCLGNNYAIGAGSCFFYGPRLPHRLCSDAANPLHKYFIAIRSGKPPKLWTQAGLLPGQHRQLRHTTAVRALFEQILEEGEQGGSETPAIVAALHHVLLLKIGASETTSMPHSDSARLYHAALDIIDREFTQIVTQQEIADRIGVTPEYLCRLFKRQQSISPYQLLLRRKLNHAERLLRNGPWNVQAAAGAVGFSDPLHFSRMFKRQLGYTPSALWETGEGRG